MRARMRHTKNLSLFLKKVLQLRAVVSTRKKSTLFSGKSHYTLHMTLHTLHITHYTLHVTHYTLHITRCTLHVTHYTLHVTHRTSHIAHYTLHAPRYTLHVTRYTLHVTRYILHATQCPIGQGCGRNCETRHVTLHRKKSHYRIEKKSFWLVRVLVH